MGRGGARKARIAGSGIEADPRAENEQLFLASHGRNLAKREKARQRLGFDRALCH
jgi:hypothetical protein